jgi:hypothetical protein
MANQSARSHDVTPNLVLPESPEQLTSDLRDLSQVVAQLHRQVLVLQEQVSTLLEHVHTYPDPVKRPGGAITLAAIKTYMTSQPGTDGYGDMLISFGNMDWNPPAGPPRQSPTSRPVPA